jgi:gliding motility-associated-like protein
MKLTLSIFLFFCITFSFSQGTDCSTADAACAGTPLTYPAGTNNGTAQPGPDYGCLLTQPNPAWFSFEIGTGGNIDIEISNSNNEDIDFILWGPFADPSSPCTALLTAGNTEDCSYSSSATETANIVGAVPGEHYLLMITNFSNNATDITFSSLGSSTGSFADNTPPDLTCSNQTVAGDASCQATLADYTSIMGISDGCDPNPTVTQSPAAGTVFTGSQTVTLTATDANGNSSNCNFDVTIIDGAPPGITCPGNQTGSFDASCQFTVPDYTALATVSDNCDAAPVVTQSPAIGSTQTGTFTVTLTATDASGNTANCTFDVVLSDNTNPIAVCQNITVYLDGAGNATITAGDVDGGSSDNCGIASLSVNPAVFTCADLGANNVTLTVGDAAGNTSSCVAIVTVQDTISPTAVCQNITAFLDGAGNATITAADIDGGSSDNCGPVTLSASSTAFTCADVGANNVTLTVTDGAGNASTCIAVVTISDTVSPAAVCQNITVFLDGAGNATITAADLDGGSSDNCGPVSLSASQTAFTCANIGVNNVTLTVTDGSGNSDNCSSIVTVNDTTSPVITCPGNQVETFNAACQFVLPDYTGLVTSSDNCGAPAVTQSPVAGTTISGNQTITMTAIDGSGNTSTCTFDIVPNDATAPTAVCQNISVYLDGTGNTSIVAADVDGGSTDNCGVPALSIDISTFDCSDVGAALNVTLTASDGVNTNSCIAQVTVLDTVSPTITCPGNTTGNVDASCNYSIPDFTGTAATDNCSTIVTQSPVAGTIVGVGTQTITLTATDPSGNTSSCTFDIVVSDNTAPSISCPGNQTDFFDASCQFIVPDYTGLATVNDNCDASPTVTQSPVVGSTQTGAFTVTLTATDAAGNSSNCTFDVNLSDNLNPTINCPGNQADFFDTSCQYTVPDYTGLATVTDNCDASPTVTQSPGIGSTQTGTFTVTLTATDASGNNSSCTFDVTLSDTISPSVTCPGNQVETFNASCEFTIVDYTSLVSTTDNCGAVASLVQSPIPGTIINGQSTITMTATDAAGNVSTCTFDVVPNDATPPTVSCPTDQSDFLDANCEFIVPDYSSMVTASDNCGIPTLTQSPAPGSTETADFTVTFIASDGINTANCSFNVLLSDSTAPVFTCPSDDIVYLDASCSYTVPDYLSSLTVTENCGVLSSTQSPVAGSTVSADFVGTIQVEDINGNITTCTFNITVEDTISPIINCPGNQNEVFDTQCQFVVPDYTLTAVTADNCGIQTYVQAPVAGTTITGLTSVSLISTDVNGNVTTCVFDIIPIDTTPPALTCPGDQFEPLNSNCESVLLDYTTMAVASDNCGNVTVTQSPVAGTAISSSTVVTITVVDDAGNSVDCNFNVIPIDNIAPVISCPSDIDICQNDPNPTWLVPLVLGECDSLGVNLTQTLGLPPGSIFTVGIHEIEYTATDSAGNQASCSFFINVEGCNPEIVIPTGLTPDNDGINDIWEIENLEFYTNVKVSIFNRWGSPIFETDNYQNDWDGTYKDEVLPTGSYFFIIELDNGKTYNGSLTILIKE